jgi:hypothetical protein
MKHFILTEEYRESDTGSVGIIAHDEQNPNNSLELIKQAISEHYDANNVEFDEKEALIVLNDWLATLNVKFINDGEEETRDICFERMAIYGESEPKPNAGFAYDEYLLAMILSNTFDEFRDLPYDEQFDRLRGIYAAFVKSGYDKTEKPLHECIDDWLHTSPDIFEISTYTGVKPERIAPKEKRVYLIDIEEGEDVHPNDIEGLSDEDFMDKAEEQGNVWSLDGFVSSMNGNGLADVILPIGLGGNSIIRII